MSGRSAKVRLGRISPIDRAPQPSGKVLRLRFLGQAGPWNFSQGADLTGSDTQHQPGTPYLKDDHAFTCSNGGSSDNAEQTGCLASRQRETL